MLNEMTVLMQTMTELFVVSAELQRRRQSPAGATFIK